MERVLLVVAALSAGDRRGEGNELSGWVSCMAWLPSWAAALSNVSILTFAQPC